MEKPDLMDLAEALVVLREEIKYRECMNDRVAEAFATLDNSDVFAAIDDASLTL